ncbi:acyl carrier protein [Micromonospora sp. CPCC 206061]|uniref:acyl carrier protein n=1 Tax=Micromonospora sp. CPCC 206061 TaxID=3122410 RepID=UPI002FEEEAF5
MNNDDALRMIRRVLSDTLGVDADAVVPDAHLRDDLGLDSLDAIDLVAALQDELGEQIESTLIADVATVGEVAAQVRRRLATQ